MYINLYTMMYNLHYSYLFVIFAVIQICTFQGYQAISLLILLQLQNDLWVKHVLVPAIMVNFQIIARFHASSFANMARQIIKQIKHFDYKLGSSKLTCFSFPIAYVEHILLSLHFSQLVWNVAGYRTLFIIYMTILFSQQPLIYLLWSLEGQIVGFMPSVQLALHKHLACIQIDKPILLKIYFYVK